MTDDLRFAGKLPVVINRNGDTRDIYNPIRSSSCDITVVSNKILSDLYTNDKKGIKVKVEKIWNEEGTQNTTLFEGYMTPNSYSQKLSPNLDNIDMTAIDPLAVLKYLYVDDILEEAKSITMGELIAKALAAVKIDCIDLWVENTVRYTDSENVNYNFVDLVLQTSNFWDEGGDPSSVYDAVSECLRLFGYTLTFTGERYMIYTVISDHDFGTYQRDFTRYKIEDGGTLRGVGTGYWIKEEHQFKHSAGEWTTIDDNPTVSIDNTYDKIVSVASTKIPNYSLTAFDMVSSEERDKYDVGAVNIQKNKIKGFNKSSANYGGGQLMTEDEWYYLWNGVYINDDYKLNITGVDVNGYANINGAYEYLTGKTGHPTAYGGLLNFYGSEDNPTGTGKEQPIERAVDVKECITVFAADNGTAPEFLEKEDLKFSLSSVYGTDDDGASTLIGYKIDKNNATDSRFGTNKNQITTNRIAYEQKYENITMSKEAEQTLVIDLTHSYSRTGFKNNINISNYSNVENAVFSLESDGDGENQSITSAILKRGTAYTYPLSWQSNQITVDSNYFNKNTVSGITIPTEDYGGVKEVWDERCVVLTLILTDGTRYQFNGKEWYQLGKNEPFTQDKGFILKKLMNGEKLFHTDFQYDLIQCADGTTYSLNPDGYNYYTHTKSGVVVFNKKDSSNGDAPSGYTKRTFSYYAAATNSWKNYIDEAEEGRLAIILPAVDAVNVNVNCTIYASNLLGMTGNKNDAAPTKSTTLCFQIKGLVEYNVEYQDDPIQTPLTESMIDNPQMPYGYVVGTEVKCDFMPVNATYIKAEHLDLDISLSVPESNLGQMFGESDVKYSTNHSKKFRESYDAPSFLVNTKHPIVSQSHSYVIVGNALADANRFSIGGMYNKIACRPENYVMQGYKNYWGTIRRTYNRVLVPHKEQFSNCLCFIEAPDIPDVGNGRWLMVVSDSWDVKTNRHTISAVEDYNLNVNEIENYTVLEIPREARNPRFNLPSVKKK